MKTPHQKLTEDDIRKEFLVLSKLSDRLFSVADKLQFHQVPHIEAPVNPVVEQSIEILTEWVRSIEQLSKRAVDESLVRRGLKVKDF